MGRCLSCLSAPKRCNLGLQSYTLATLKSNSTISARPFDVLPYKKFLFLISRCVTFATRMVAAMHAICWQKPKGPKSGINLHISEQQVFRLPHSMGTPNRCVVMKLTCCLVGGGFESSLGNNTNDSQPFGLFTLWRRANIPIFFHCSCIGQWIKQIAESVRLMIASYEPRDRRLCRASLRLSLWMKPSYTRLWLQTHSLRNVPPRTQETGCLLWARNENIILRLISQFLCGTKPRRPWSLQKECDVCASCWHYSQCENGVGIVPSKKHLKNLIDCPSS